MIDLIVHIFYSFIMNHDDNDDLLQRPDIFT